MVVVGIVFALLLRTMDLGSLLPWVNFLLDYVMPAVVLLDWLLVSKNQIHIQRSAALPGRSPGLPGLCLVAWRGG